MKKILSLLVISVFCIFFSCKKDSFQNPMSLSELFDYTNFYNTPCTGKLNHDEENVVITGYIKQGNTFLGENRFLIFENNTFLSRSLQVNIINNSDLISKKIYPALIHSGFIKITLRVRIISKPIYTYFDSFMGISLTLDNEKDIRF